MGLTFHVHLISELLNSWYTTWAAYIKWPLFKAANTLGIEKKPKINLQTNQRNPQSFPTPKNHTEKNIETSTTTKLPPTEPDSKEYQVDHLKTEYFETLSWHFPSI